MPIKWNLTIDSMDNDDGWLAIASNYERTNVNGTKWNVKPPSDADFRYPLVKLRTFALFHPFRLDIGLQNQ